MSQLSLLFPLLFAACERPVSAEDAAGGDSGHAVVAATDSGVDETAARDTGSGGDLALGPMAAAVGPDTATIWVRLARPGVVQVAYDTSPAMRRPTLAGPVTAAEEGDNTAAVVLDGLAPDTVYYYQVLVDGAGAGDAEPHQVRTFPREDASADFSFAVLADVRAEIASPSYRAVAGDAPAFALQIGDFDHRDPYTTHGLDIEGWREMHREMLGDSPHGEDFARWILPRMPLFHIWDDHDYGDNNGDARAPYRAIATQAFREYFPTPPGPNPSAGLWYAFRYAQAEIFVLDLRSQRSPNVMADGPDKTMLDAEGLADGQKAWLKTSLANSTATWKFVVSSSVWNPHAKPRDSWAEYATEQRELVDWIRENGVAGVVVLSGDIHTGGAIDDGTNSYLPELSVPASNLGGECTGGAGCGSWSVGVREPSLGPGYALITVRHDAEAGVHTCVLETRDEGGATTLSYTLTQ